MRERVTPRAQRRLSLRGACVADVIAATQRDHSKAKLLGLPGLQRELRDGLPSTQLPPPVVADFRSIRQLRMSVRELDAVVVRRYTDGTLLLPAPGLCLLDIGVVRAEIPRELEVDGASSTVPGRQHNVQAGNVHVIRQTNIQRSFRKSVSVQRFFIP